MRPLQFLEQHFGRYQLSRQEALFFCPFCLHHKPKLSVNLDNYCWKCWVCDEKGRSLLGLVLKAGNRETITQYKASFPIELKPKPDPSLQNFQIELPAGYLPLCQNFRCDEGKRALIYLKKRNVTPMQIIRHKLGIATHGLFRDRIILPSFDSAGVLNFFTGRTFKYDPYRYLNPKTPYGYKKSIIFNELNIDWKRPVTLVEGYFDMLAADDNVIPLFGSTVPEDSKLFLALVQHEPVVYVCLDADARQKQLTLIKSLNAFGIKALDVDIRPHKDVAETPAHVLQERRENASSLDRMSILRERIRAV